LTERTMQAREIMRKCARQAYVVRLGRWRSSETDATELLQQVWLWLSTLRIWGIIFGAK
jgi:hypothetical protein